MQTWDAIRARRNVRDYTAAPIAAADLDQILEAGRRSPSASNRQRWDFVLCTERSQLTDLAGVWRGAGHVAGAAAAIALIAPDYTDVREAASVNYDLGQATMSMMIAAADLGIGTAHAGVSDQDLARRILGFPADRVCAWLIAAGHPAGRPLTPILEPNRRPFDDVVHRGGW